MLRLKAIRKLTEKALNALLGKLNTAELSVREIGYTLWIFKSLDVGTHALLNTYRSEGIKLLLKMARIEKRKTGISVNFEDEIWDTSLALIAFSDSGKDDISLGILRYLRECYTEESEILEGSYEGDVWETCFATLAILHALESKVVEPQEGESFSYLEQVQKSCQWLIDMVRLSHGYVVSPHHSALVAFTLLRVERFLAGEGLGTLFNEEGNDLRSLLCNVVEKGEIEVRELATNLDRLWQSAIVVSCIGEIAWENRRTGRFSTICSEEKADSMIETYRVTLNRVSEQFMEFRIEDLALAILSLLNVSRFYVDRVPFAEVEQEYLAHRLRDDIKKNIDIPSHNRFYYRDDDGTVVMRITREKQKRILAFVSIVTAGAGAIVTFHDFFDAFWAWIGE